MTTEKIYLTKYSARSKTFNNGGTILKIGFDVESLIAFVKEHKNANGWIDLNVCQLRAPTEKKSHYIMLDTYQPKKRA